MKISELFNKPNSNEIWPMKQTESIYRVAATIEGRTIVFQAQGTGMSEEKSWAIDFINLLDSTNSHGDTADHAALEVLAFVKEAMLEFIEERKPLKMTFLAKGKRAAVYKRMVKSVGGAGYEFIDEQPYFALVKTTSEPDTNEK